MGERGSMTNKWLWAVFVLLLVFACTPGCSSTPPPPSEERLLTKEQDEAVGRMCAEGCAVIPAEQYLEMKRRLQQQGV